MEYCEKSDKISTQPPVKIEDKKMFGKYDRDGAERKSLERVSDAAETTTLIS